MTSLIKLIEELEGAGLIITDLEEVESELRNMGFNPEVEIEYSDEEDSDFDDEDLS